MAAGNLYPDFSINSATGNHLAVRYYPQFSDDLTNLGQGSLIQRGEASYWGRSFLVAVPPGGDLTISYNCRAAGSFTDSQSESFIDAAMPLVQKGPRIESRGHTLISINVFPQCRNNGIIKAYDQFEIEVYLTPSYTAVNKNPEYSRLDTVVSLAVINPDQFFDFGIKAVSRPALKVNEVAFDDTARWFKITTNASGITRITGSALSSAGVDLTDLPTTDLRVYYGGGEHPSFNPADPEPELNQISIRAEDGGDGVFDSGDYLLFYAEALNRYDFDSGEPVYVKNNYCEQNCYWLAAGNISGEANLYWEDTDGIPAGSPDDVLYITMQPVRAEEDNVLRDNTGSVWDYYTWYWDDGTIISTSVNLPNLAEGDSLDMGITALGSYSYSIITLNGVSLTRYYDGGQRYYDNSGAGVDGLNSIQVQLKPGYDPTLLDYLDIIYPQRLNYISGGLDFNSYGHEGRLRFSISNYSNSLTLLDLTDPDHPNQITGVDVQGSTGIFEKDVTGGSISRFLVFADSDIKNPIAVNEESVGGLRADTDQYDCIVVSPRSFQDALQEYVSFRSGNGYRVKLTAVEDIYNDFGFGLESPMAIRSYLEYAYENYAAPAPYSVILAGDGHYDFLDRLGLGTPSYVPPFIWPQLNSAGDDYFVYFDQEDSLDGDGSYNGDDRGWDMMIARWPVRSSSEVNDYIEKLKSYESASSQGSWRSCLTFVADDEFKGQNTDEIIHTAQAETLAVLHTPSDFIRNKIYLTEYPFASGGTKPTVNDDIVAAVNNGTLIINYIGHGSPDVWADEHVLNKGSDLSRMTNTDKLAVFVAASCSIGKFDAPDQEGMAEVLFRQEGGAISVVSATRLVYSSDNARFTYDLYDCIFEGGTNICESVYTTKMLHQYLNYPSLIKNDRAYSVLSDPLAERGWPEYRVVVDSLSEATMTPLTEFAFYGRVTDEDDDPVVDNGELEIVVQDSPIIRQHDLGISYILPGATIFRGKVSVSDGQYTAGFIVPLDIDYGGQLASMTGYAALTGTAGLGGQDSIPMAEQVGVSTDSEGPEITYYFEENPEFVTGDFVPTEALLVVEFSDVSGINLTGSLGHRIELIIDGDNSSTLNLTDYFNYQTGDYQAGYLEYTLPELSAELHLFKIRAWDNANNSAEAEFEAMVTRSGRIEVVDLMNYPNPMEEGTEFFFELSEVAESVELQIFTLSGKKIKEYRSLSPKVGRNRMFYFDGRDQDGDRVASGIYIYKLTARGKVAAANESADNIAEAFGKLVVLN